MGHMPACCPTRGWPFKTAGATQTQRVLLRRERQILLIAYTDQMSIGHTRPPTSPEQYSALSGLVHGNIWQRSKPGQSYLSRGVGVHPQNINSLAETIE
jgi:hypothetical protein